MCVESLLSVMENPHPEVSGTDTDILLCDLLRERIKRVCEKSMEGTFNLPGKHIINKIVHIFFGLQVEFF